MEIENERPNSHKRDRGRSPMSRAGNSKELEAGLEECTRRWLPQAE